MAPRAMITRSHPSTRRRTKARDLVKADHYDDFAENYSTENESSLLNAYYERPAMIDLAGDVNSHRVLDAGCGSGPLSAALRAKGAVVTGFDSQPGDGRAGAAEAGRECSPARGRPQPATPVRRRRVRRRRRIPCSALPAGLDGTPSRAAARSEARRPPHPVGEPPHHVQADQPEAPTTSPSRSIRRSTPSMARAWC